MPWASSTDCLPVIFTSAFAALRAKGWTFPWLVLSATCATALLVLKGARSLATVLLKGVYLRFHVDGFSAVGLVIPVFLDHTLVDLGLLQQR